MKRARDARGTSVKRALLTSLSPKTLSPVALESAARKCPTWDRCAPAAFVHGTSIVPPYFTGCALHPYRSPGCTHPPALPSTPTPRKHTRACCACSAPPPTPRPSPSARVWGRVSARAWQDNTGKRRYIEDMVFPTLQFPSDHGIVATTLKIK